MKGLDLASWGFRETAQCLWEARTFLWLEVKPFCGLSGFLKFPLASEPQSEDAGSGGTGLITVSSSSSYPNALCFCHVFQTLKSTPCETPHSHPQHHWPAPGTASSSFSHANLAQGFPLWLGSVTIEADLGGSITVLGYSGMLTDSFQAEK